MNTRNIGNISEQKVADYLIENGFVILERNYRIIYAEIDIIATKNNIINFIEVKKIPSYWDGVDISAKINMQKIRKIRNAASVYLAQCSKKKYDSISFDVAIVTADCVTMYYGAF